MNEEKKQEDIVVNGKVYPLWQQFVQRKDEWIGGILEDFGDAMDRAMGYKPQSTEIVNIELLPNGEESAMFQVSGKDFTAGSDVRYLGVTAGDEGWITLGGYGGHTWRIKQKDNDAGKDEHREKNILRGKEAIKEMTDEPEGT